MLIEDEVKPGRTGSAAYSSVSVGELVGGWRTLVNTTVFEDELGGAIGADLGRRNSNDDIGESKSIKSPVG